MSPAPVKPDVSLNIRCAEDCCVEALTKLGKLWTALEALCVASQLVNSLDAFCA